jgi:aryl-alcohol dehydrogenase-like predicted oxidoreductase
MNILGNSDLNISPLGVGAWAMGGPGWKFSWGPQDDSDSLGAIGAALEAGWNWIDTAAVYGLGHSEQIVGKALRGLQAKPYIFTKCGRVWDSSGMIGRSLRAASVRAECEASLRRLGVDRIDLYQMHWPEPDEEIEEGWAEMARLREEGKVRWIGVSNFNAAQLRRAQAIAPVSSLQPPYSLISPEVEAEILPYCAAQGIGVLVYSPMKSGLLSGQMTRERIAALPADDFRRGVAHFKEPKLTENLELVEQLRAIGARRGLSPAEVAIAWTLRNDAVTAAIVGLRSAAQLTGVQGALYERLTSGEVEEIGRFLNKRGHFAA